MNDSQPATENLTPTTGALDERLQEEQFDEMEQFDELLLRLESADEGSPSLRTLTRLLVGGLLIGREELLVRLRQWERDARKVKPPQKILQKSQKRTVVIDAEFAAA